MRSLSLSAAALAATSGGAVPPAPTARARTYSCDGRQLTETQIAKRRRITLEQLRLLGTQRGLTPDGACKLPEAALRRELAGAESPIRPSQPDAALRHRLLELRDENGLIPPNALVEARRHIDRMREEQERSYGAVPPAAGITPGAWTWLGPGNVGGRLRAILVHPTTPTMMWVGSVGGGIWKTTNGGVSWSPVDDFMANLAVPSLAMDPTDPSVMYAGTGEGFFNGDSIQGAGIFKSTDGGTTWAQLGSTASTSFNYVNRLAISPNGATILAATGSGIFRSSDGGATWSQRHTTRTVDVDFDPTNSDRAIAGRGDGKPLYSTDGGSTWAVAATPSSAFRVEVAYAASSPSTTYAAVDNASGQLWKSIDGGVTYALVNDVTHPLGTQGWYDNALWVSPVNPDVVMWGGIQLWRSTNGGVTFSSVGGLHVDHHAIVHDPGFNGTTNKKVYFGNDGGIYRADVSTEGVTTGMVELNNNLGVTQFYGAAGNNTTGTIIGGTQDNGTQRYTTAGGSEAWTSMAGGDGSWAAADQTNSNYFYGAYQYLGVHRSSNGGASTTSIYSGITDAGGSCSNFIAPFVLDPNDPHTLLAGGCSLWRTNNARSTPAQPTWAVIRAAGSGAVSAIAVAPGNSNIVWVGYNNGDVYKTGNGTASSPTWTRVDTNPAALPNRKVTRITIDPNDPNTVYATFGGFSNNNVYRTTDGGSTWADRTGTGATGLPNIPIRSLVMNPDNSQWIYVGGESGIFASEDAGATWHVPHDGPANVSVDELFFLSNATRDLVAATHGRGMFKQSTTTSSTTVTLGFTAPSTTVAEAGGSVAATVQLATSDGNPTTAQVTVHYAAANGTAASPQDFASSVGTLTFPAGTAHNTTQTVDVSLIDDAIDEPNESFSINLSAPGGPGAVLGQSTHAVTITDDDAEPAVSISDVTIPEPVSGSSSATFNVSLSAASGQTVTVNYATADGTATSMATTGSNSGAITILTTGTAPLASSPYPATISVSGVTGGVSKVTATLTNINHPYPRDLDVLLVGPTGQSVILMSDVGSSADAANVTLTFDDAAAGGPGSGTLVSGTYKPTNTSDSDGTDTYASPAPVGPYGSALAAFNGLDPNGSWSLYVVADYAGDGVGSISGGWSLNIQTPTGDYTGSSGTLTFSPGQTSKSLPVTVLSDSVTEGSETFFVNLSSPVNATIGDGQGQGTILAPLTCPATASPGASFTVAVNAGASATDWLALYASTTAADASYLSFQYVPLPRPASRTVVAPATNGTYQLRLFANNGYMLLGLCTFQVIPTPTLSIGDASATEGDSGSVNAVFTVTLNPAATGVVTVDFATANATATGGSDYTTTSGSLTFAASETTKTITVPVLGDTLGEGNETFQANLSNATGAPVADAQGIGTIVDNDTGITAGPSCVLSTGSRAASVTVTGGPGNAGDWVGVYLSGSSSYANWWYLNGTQNPPGTGLVNASFNVTMPAAVGNYSFKLHNVGGTVVFTSNVVAVAASCGPSLSINDVSVTEGDSGSVNGVFTVTLSPTSSGTVTVNYATANGTATAGSDYTTTTGSLTFNASETTKTVTVPVLGDTLGEGNETFQVNLSNAAGAPVADAQGIGTIVDNDIGITASPSCVLSTGSRTAAVTVTGGPGNAGDWVGVYLSGSSSYANWWYLSGTQNPPGTGLVNASFNVTMPATVGNYTFKLHNAGGTVVFTSNVVGVAASCGPSLSIGDVSVTEGDSGSVNAVFTVTLSPAATGVVTVDFATGGGTATAGSDYTTTTGSLTFAASETTKTISVPVLGDTLGEGNETLQVNLSNAAGAPVGDAQGIGTIVDNDIGIAASPSCVLSTGSRAASVTVTGGPGNAGDWVGVYRSGQTGYADWWYLNGTQNPPGTGLLNASFNVTMPATVGNYTFKLHNAGGTVVFTSNVVGVAASCGPSLSIGDASVTEGDSGSVSGVFTVTLSPAATGVVAVDFATGGGTATAGSDYTTTTGSLTFNASETTKTISVPVLGDTLGEGNETFQVNLSNAAGAPVADAQGIGTIVDNDIGIAAGPSCVLSTGSRTAPVTVTGGPGNAGDWVGVYLSGSSSYANWWYLNGTQNPPGTGLVNASFNVTMPAAVGNYSFKLHNAGGTVVFTSNVVAVAASCGPSLSIGDVSVTEGDSGSVSGVFTVTLNPAATGVVTVDFATGGGTATVGSDYTTTTGSLTFNASETTKTISVPVLGDTLGEGNETFQVNLSNATGAPVADAQGIGTIVDNDIGITASPSCVLSTGSRTASVTVTGGPGNAGDWVGVYLSGSSSYANWWYLSGTQNPPGTGLVNASFNVTMPTTVGNYSFKLHNVGGTVVFTSNVVAVAASCGPSLSIGDASVTEGNTGPTNAVFTVTLNPVATGVVTVDFATAAGTATAGSDYVSSSGTLTFNAGESTKSVTVGVNGDLSIEGNETFLVNLSNATGGAAIGDGQGQGTIVDNDTPPALACPTSVSPGLSFTVTVNAGSSSSDWMGIYASSTTPDDNYLPPFKYAPLPRPATVTFTAPGTNGTYELRLFANNGYLRLGTCTFQVMATPTLSINDVSVTEGNTGTVNATFTVTLSPTSTTAVEFIYATANGTATAGSDYVATSGMPTFNPGESTKTVSVSVNGDLSIEGNETFFVNLSSVTGGAAIGDAQGQATIVDNDAPPALTCPTAPLAGTSFTTTVNGGSSAYDWVALAAQGSASDIYLSYQYAPLPRPATLTFTSPTTAGTYELRLFANNGYTLMGSCTFVLGGPAPPALISPAQGAVLDNGCIPPKSDDIVWDFSWSAVSLAERYHLYVKGPTASIPVIDDANVTATSYHDVRTAYVANQNRLGWRWKVRVRVGGVWGPFSAERTFDVEPPNTDCPIAPP